MSQNPTPSTLFVSKIQGGAGVAISPAEGTGIVTIDLAGSAQEIANTNITTAGNGTLTAAAIAGGLITRSGPTGAFSDATATAVAIVAAIPGAFAGQSFYVTVRNTVAFAQTITAGVGVTITGSAIVPPNSVATYLMTITALTTVTLRHVGTGPLSTANLMVTTALTTNGAGTITGAGVAGGFTVRTGATAAFTDTTDTADNIIAARPNAHIGDSWVWNYQNNVNFLATLAGGTGVTVSGITLVPGQSTARFLVTYTAADTVTIVGVALSPNISLPPAKFTTAALSAATLAAGAITGAAMSVLQNTGATPGNQTVRTAAQMLADIPGAYVGLTVMFRIVNTGAGTLTLVADGGATVTLTGTMATLTNTFRDYTLTFTGATAATIQSVGSGVSP